MRGEQLGYFEIADKPTRVFEGEPFELDMRLGWDEQLLVRTAQLFLPWWGELPGILELEQGPRNPSQTWHEFTVNRRSKALVEEVGRVSRGGSPFRGFRLYQRYLAARPGTLTFPESSFEFSRIIEKGDGFFRPDRVEELYVVLPGFEVEVLPVPEEGRPLEWGGAVGRIDVVRRVDRRDVDSATPIKLTVVYSGRGNLEFFDPPDPSRLDAFSDFRVLGVEDKYELGLRRVTYDLVPLAPEVDEIPSLETWVFDTAQESFRVVETEPVPIRVRALAGGSGLDDLSEAEGEVHDLADIQGVRNAGSTLRRPGSWVVVANLFAVPLLWLLARMRVRRRYDPDAPLERRRRGARRALRKELARARSASAQTAAVSRFLGARTREGDQAWVGRPPIEWVESQDGPPEDLPGERAFGQLTELMSDLDQSAWAAGDAPLETSRILSVCETLLKGGL